MHFMKSKTFLIAAAFALPLLTGDIASAHIGYTNRNFGSFTGDAPATVTLAATTVTSSFGWADGTDADFGDSHLVKAYRFTLQNTADVTITIVSALTDVTTGTTTVFGGLIPGYSLYKGLAHVSPQPADYDGTPITQAWLDSIPGPQEGAFDALHTWKAGNEEGTTFADLSTFDFAGYAADGTSANFGSADIAGDGVADGNLTKTFRLPAGTYSMFVGGGNYAAQNIPAESGKAYGFTSTLSVEPVPEPATAGLLAIGAFLAACTRRRPVSSG